MNWKIAAAIAAFAAFVGFAGGPAEVVLCHTGYHKVKVQGPLRAANRRQQYLDRREERPAFAPDATGDPHAGALNDIHQ